MQMLVVLSHTLLKEQIKEAKEELKVDSIIEIPKELKEIWGNISPYGFLPINSIKKIVQWVDINSEEGDYVLVQGEFGATYYMVNYCIKNGRIPIYATTNREVEEKVENGAIKINRVFRHVNFRKYLCYN